MCLSIKFICPLHRTSNKCFTRLTFLPVPILHTNNFYIQRQVMYILGDKPPDWLKLSLKYHNIMSWNINSGIT